MRRRGFGPRQPEIGQLPLPNENVLRAGSLNNSRSERGRNEKTYNLLTCLACAQQRGLDFIGISWIDAQGVLGRGGQAVVSETRASVDTVLAFKRRDSSRVGSWLSLGTLSQMSIMENFYREIASEIMALGEPSFRNHPNIVQLKAIGWEIQNVSSWLPFQRVRVWPVLIFEKADHHDLRKFMATSDGKSLSLVQRLRICHDIASAICAAHTIGIIHGDIKPENVLVFGTKEITVKLADFGFCAFASNEVIRLGGTDPWSAPEIHTRLSHKLAQAKLTDLYSFGVLCLWIIFREDIAERGQALQQPPRGSVGQIIDKISGIWVPQAAAAGPDIKFISEHKSTLMQQAVELVECMRDSKWKDKLRQLLTVTLTVDSSHRSFGSAAESDFEFIVHLLDVKSNEDTPQGITIATTENSSPDIPAIPSKTLDGSHPSASFPTASAFQVSQSLRSLCHADFRVRCHIFECLEKEYDSVRDTAEKSKLALQMAFCYKIGFGTERNEGKVADYLRSANDLQEDHSSSQQIFDAAYLQSMIEQSGTVPNASSAWLQNLYNTGIIQPVHQGIEMRHKPPHVQKRILQDRQKEIDRMKTILGETHPAVLNLKWAMLTSIMEGQDPLEPIEFLHEMVKSMESKDGPGPNHRDTLMTKAYRCLALMRICGPHEIELIENQARSAWDDLSQSDAHEHVATSMVCMALADCLAFRGRFKDSRFFMDLAKQSVVAKFGPDHPNTVSLLQKEADYLLREGNMVRAIEVTEEALEKMLVLVEKDELGIVQMRDMLAMLLFFTGNYDKADKVVEGTYELFKRKLPSHHPALAGARVSLAMYRGRYAEVISMMRGTVRIMSWVSWWQGWPPKKDDHPVNVYSKVKESDVIRELLGENGQPKASKPYVDPKKFAVPPELMMARAVLILALHAEAAREKKFVWLDREGDAHMQSLLKDIDASFEIGSKQSDALLEDDGVAPSVMLKAIHDEYIGLVEILAFLGDLNSRKGLHYDKAIAASRGSNFTTITTILEEHRDICANGPDYDKPPMFKNTGELRTWVSGHWGGCYLYRSSGPRKDPKGTFTLSLQADETIAQNDIVNITGTGVDDMGETFIKGDISVSGNVLLCMYKEGGEELGWEYKGRANPARKAFGGFWGPRGADIHAAGGTFFFYKG